MLERELPASVLLGSELAGRGHHVWLIEKGRFRKSPASFAPSIILEKGVTTGCLPKFRSIRGAGHIIAVMCQEGFTYRSGDDYIDRRVFERNPQERRLSVSLGRKRKTDLEGSSSDRSALSRHRQPALRSSASPFAKSWEAKRQEILARAWGFRFLHIALRLGQSLQRDSRRDRRQSVMETYTGDAVSSAPQRFRYLRQLFSRLT